MEDLMSTLLQPIKPVILDVNNIDHRKAYVIFLNTGKWPIVFELEWPFTNLPSMCMMKFSIKACEDAGEINQDLLYAKAATHTQYTTTRQAFELPDFEIGGLIAMH